MRLVFSSFIVFFRLLEEMEASNRISATTKTKLTKVARAHVHIYSHKDTLSQVNFTNTVKRAHSLYLCYMMKHIKKRAC